MTAVICTACLSRDCTHVSMQAPPLLTERHASVLRLLGAGMKNKEIAARLGLTHGTVKVYLSKFIFPRIGATNRLQASLWALKHEELLREIDASRGVAKTALLSCGLPGSAKE